MMLTGRASRKFSGTQVFSSNGKISTAKSYGRFLRNQRESLLNGLRGNLARAVPVAEALRNSESHESNVLRSISSGRSGIGIVDNHALQMLDHGGEARHAVFGQDGAGLGEGVGSG